MEKDHHYIDALNVAVEVEPRSQRTLFTRLGNIKKKLSQMSTFLKQNALATGGGNTPVGVISSLGFALTDAVVGQCVGHENHWLATGG